MTYKELYDEIKTVYTKFRREAIFYTFGTADIFYIMDTNGGSCIATFIDQFFGDCVGVQLFTTRDGRNYVHDVLSSGEEAAPSIGDCDSIVVVEKKKEDLTGEDRAFLSKMGRKVTKERNLIPYRFKRGYRQRICNLKELMEANLYIVFLSSVIQNESLDLITAFNTEYAALISLDLEHSEYGVMYRSLPMLEEPMKKQKANEPFIEEYKDTVYLKDLCYLYTTYLPVSVRETGVRPLMLYFYFANANKMIVKYISEAPKEYGKLIYGIIDEVFSGYGVPEEMVFNNRIIYAMLTKTLDGLHIENTLERNNVHVNENVGMLVSQIYSKTQDGEVETKENVDSLMKIVTDVLNNMDSEIYDEEFQETEPEEFVS